MPYLSLWQWSVQSQDDAVYQPNNEKWYDVMLKVGKYYVEN